MADKTNFLFNPNYIDVGDVKNNDYYTIPADPADIDLGDLIGPLSYKELMELSTDVGDNLDRPNQTVVLRAVQQAEAFVDSKVAIHYPVPTGLDSGNVPPSIQGVAMKLFKFFLYSRRPTMPDQVLVGYEQADRWLSDVAARRAVVPEFEIVNNQVDGQYETDETVVGSVDRSNSVFSNDFV